MGFETEPIKARRADVHIPRGEAVTQQVTAEEIRQLLLGYSVALDAAESLPPVVRIASRPRRWTVLEPLRRLPRPTIGTWSMVTHHVQRSTAVLARRYARIAATRGLTDEDERASALVRTFRESLTDVRWKIIVPGLLIAALAAIEVVLRGVASMIEAYAKAQVSDAEQGRLDEALKRALFPVFSPEAFGDLLSEVGKAHLAGLLVLAGTVIVVGYVVFRPLSPAFRLKRTLFNLAPSGRIDLALTTSTWNVTHSAGLYDLERTLFARLGARLPNETNVDLWVSAAGAAGLAFFLAFLGIFQVSQSDEDTVTGGVLTLGFGAGLIAARAVWLLHTARARRRTVAPADPCGFAAPYADRIVETRSVIETAAIGALFLPGFLSWLALPMWVRLVRERRDLDRASVRAWGRPGRLPSGSVWPALGSAVLLVLVPPLPVALHLTRLAHLQPPGVGSARRTRAWLVPLVTAAMLLFWVGSSVEPYEPVRAGLIVVAYGTAFAVAYGAIQREQNALIWHVGTPLPHDDPLWDAGIGITGQRVAHQTREQTQPPAVVDPPGGPQAA